MSAFRTSAIAFAFAAILAVAAFAPAAAESPVPPPPARFVGRVTVAGHPAPVGETVHAYVGPSLCGTGSTYLKVFFPGPFSGPVVETHYVVDVAAVSPANPGCGYINAPVRFTVGSQPAGPLSSWKNYQLNQHNLAVLFRY